MYLTTDDAVILAVRQYVEEHGYTAHLASWRAIIQDASWQGYACVIIPNVRRLRPDGYPDRSHIAVLTKMEYAPVVCHHDHALLTLKYHADGTIEPMPLMDFDAADPRSFPQLLEKIRNL